MADLEPLGQRIACILRNAFNQPGSPIPSLEAGCDETQSLLERIQEGWKVGAPAVTVVKPELDRALLLHRLLALVECTEHEYSPARRFREVSRTSPDRVVDWVLTRLCDGSEDPSSELEHARIPAEYARSILRLTLLGELGEWSSRITEHLTEPNWRYFGCPVCGRPPALGESRGLEQRRYLRCNCCGAGWPANRLQCPFCGQNDGHRMRSFFAEEDQHRCRLVVCDDCGGRLKVVTTLAPLSPPGLVVAEFTMLYLDELNLDDLETSSGGS
jgi:formate dehydrogenase maturation protein FdhE